MTLVSTNKSKEIAKNYEELRNKIRDLIRLITKNWDDFGGTYMKIKIISDDDIPLNKMIEIPSIIIVVRAIFQENSKYYLQVFLDEFLY